MNPRTRHRRIAFAVAAALTLTVSLLAAPSVHAMGYPRMWDRQILPLASDNAAERDAAIAEFRRMGPGGLDRLREFWFDRGELALDHTRIKGGQPKDRLGLTADQMALLRDAIDRVAGQRDATSAWLYWYTDRSAAQAEAARLGKPILSLRLLGELTDEYSCANSRFFRTVLYANPDVAAYLGGNYVLHWSSERPVPVVTIDFGDGRSVKRTITGNSIHYVLDAGGRVIDALPGLYAPADFLRIVRQGRDVATTVAPMNDTERTEALAAYHRFAGERIEATFRDELSAIGVVPPVAANRPDAADAAPRARGKAMIEAPVLMALAPDFASKLARTLGDDQWGRLADSRLAAAGGRVLHPASIALMRSQNAAAYDMDAALFDRTVAKFERQVVIDTMRNELLMRRVIHGWLTEQPERTTPMAALNERVYAELFLTPADDADLGLLPADVYTGHGAGAAPAASVSRR